MFVVYFYDYQECDDGPYGFIGVASESDAQELILSFAEEDSYEDTFDALDALDVDFDMLDKE